MNTPLNYVGKGESATTFPQMAQNEGQTSSTVDNRQPNTLLESQFEELHSMINQFFNDDSPSRSVELINELMLGNMHSSIGFDPESDYEPGKQYQISQADLARLFSPTRLIEFLVKLGETWKRIERS